ncbi:maleylpyruvate isomerase N-terminal domain-containing protein [Rhizomonospora bruguierae]|uniref:maleylpyruvate isomerase N-terminal domain-containing protein n=1 Tax=Rhizomonospora bruguierae TaxID=1581705 RepID=UPI001BCB78B8|nr:maleylpyruvate isomerase N-terminal domain-containing protein [Micromonospora sp. NBRC 107566]
MIRDAYLEAATAAATLLRDPAVSAAWNEPSALTGFTVGGLSAHLARQVSFVPLTLATPLPDQSAPISLLAYYAQAAWVEAGPDDAPNVGIRDAGEKLAEPGIEPLLARLDAELADLRETLRVEPADRLVQIMPADRTLTFDDFLLGRTMELVVHSDDLAVSVQLPTPPLPATVVEPVVDLLTRIAMRRRGSVAMVRALSRAERAPATISAF